MKILVVYNTCGIKRDNTEWYIRCISELLQQKCDDYRIVWSSCLNSPECFKQVYNTFRDKISYCCHAEPHTVNITFNKTVQECVKQFGLFEACVYIDSGCSFGEQTDILDKAYKNFKLNEYGIMSLQTDTDEALQVLGPNFVYQSSEPQIKNEDYVISSGKACNAHVLYLDKEIFKAFNNKLWPDVFAAYCTESTFTFLCSAIKKRWAILRDIQVRHEKSVDGASLSVPHWSLKHNNPWNNLLYGRDALDFINDREAIDCGLGYEECNNIMMHNPAAYDEHENSLYPDKLAAVINKFFFLSKNELNYDKIKFRFVP